MCVVLRSSSNDQKMSEILNLNSLEFEYKLLQLKHQKFQIEYVKIKTGYEEKIVELEGQVQ